MNNQGEVWELKLPVVGLGKGRRNSRNAAVGQEKGTENSRNAAVGHGRIHQGFAFSTVPTPNLTGRVRICHF